MIINVAETNELTSNVVDKIREEQTNYILSLKGKNITRDIVKLSNLLTFEKALEMWEQYVDDTQSNGYIFGLKDNTNINDLTMELLDIDTQAFYYSPEPNSVWKDYIESHLELKRL